MRSADSRRRFAGTILDVISSAERHRGRTPYVFALILPLVLLATPGCSDVVSTEQRVNRGGVDRSLVTGEALDALSATGHFQLRVGPTWRREELTAADAQVFADVFVKRFASTLPSWFSRHHGAPIDFEALRPCGTPRYAESPYEEPASDSPDWLVDIAAPRWLFVYCLPGDIPAVSIAVATTATHLRQSADKARIEGIRGNEFGPTGIPRGAVIPMPPERAIELAAATTNRKVSRVPNLILTGRPHAPQAARWQISLDGEASIQDRAGRTRTVQRAFVGSTRVTWDAEVSVDAGTAPGADSITLRSGETFVLRRRPDLPSVFAVVY